MAVNLRSGPSIGVRVDTAAGSVPGFTTPAPAAVARPHWVVHVRNVEVNLRYIAQVTSQ